MTHTIAQLHSYLRRIREHLDKFNFVEAAAVMRLLHPEYRNILTPLNLRIWAAGALKFSREDLSISPTEICFQMRSYSDKRVELSFLPVIITAEGVNRVAIYLSHQMLLYQRDGSILHGLSYEEYTYWIEKKPVPGLE